MSAGTSNEPRPTERWWLAPIAAGEPVRIGGDRFVCEPLDTAARFRERLGRIHPRLLMTFKTELLLERRAALARADSGAAGAAIRAGEPRADARAPIDPAPPDVPADNRRICAAQGTAWRPDQPGELVCDGAPYALTACGLAFVRRLPASPEALSCLERAARLAQQENWSASERSWLDRLILWHREGWNAVLLR